MQKLREWHRIFPTVLLTNLHQATCQKFLSRFEICWLRIWIVARSKDHGGGGKSEWISPPQVLDCLNFFFFVCFFGPVTLCSENKLLSYQKAGLKQTRNTCVWSRALCLPWAASYKPMASVMEPGLTSYHRISWVRKDSPGLLSPTTGTGPPSRIPPYAWVCCMNVS